VIVLQKEQVAVRQETELHKLAKKKWYEELTSKVNEMSDFKGYFNKKADYLFDRTKQVGDTFASQVKRL